MKESDEIVSIFKKGGLVIFPTETVYALGCLAANRKSVERLYKIKKRPPNQPTLAIFPDLGLVKKYVEFTSFAETLAEKFWPGPLTIILKNRKNLPKEVLGAGNTLAVRIPSLPWLLEILKELNEPLLAPSANFKGEKAAKHYNEIDKELAKLVDYVVNTEPKGAEPSTIVDLTSVPYKIVREGAVKKAALKSYF